MSGTPVAPDASPAPQPLAARGHALAVVLRGVCLFRVVAWGGEERNHVTLNIPTYGTLSSGARLMSLTQANWWQKQQD